MADPREEGLIYLDGLIEKLRGRAEAVNSFWLKAIGKRIRELKNLDPSDAAGIAAIRNDTQLIADITSMVQKAGEDTVEDARNVLRAAARLSMEASPVAQDLAMEEWINGIAEATAGQLSNMANTSVVGVWTPSGFQMPKDAYIAAIDQTAAQMASGTMGLNAAVRSVLKQFADSGLAVVQYESGRTRSLGAAVEMNLREATSMVYQGVQRRIGQEYGADGIEISAHWDCAPDHLDIQGKQYSMADFEKLQRSLARPIGTMNCRHTTYTIILGISPTTYSDAELQAMKDASLRTKEFDGKEYTQYEASQVQRKLEREIRRQKNRTIIAKEAGDDEMRREAQMKINQLTGKYKDLSDAFGLKTKTERMAVSGYKPLMNMNRKSGNPGAFSIFPERMTKKHVREVAKEFGINLKGIEIVIDANEELINAIFTGEANPESIGQVIFFPQAFKSKEELVRTIFHELQHVDQYKKYGTIYVQENKRIFEELAYKAENDFIEKLKATGKL